MKILKDKRGVVGLDTAKAVILAVLIISVIAITTFLSLQYMLDATNALDLNTANLVRNESVTMNNNYVGLTGNDGVANCNPTIVIIQNASSGKRINGNNYTLSGCSIKNITGEFVDKPWNVSYTYTYNKLAQNVLVSNVTSGATTFFTNASTWFTLLSIVIIILIIGIVIVAVNRYSGREGSGM